jgi:hypothetical protein
LPSATGVAVGTAHRAPDILTEAGEVSLQLGDARTSWQASNM